MLRSTIYLCAVALMLAACGPEESRAPAPPTDSGHRQWSEAEANELTNSHSPKCEAGGGSNADCADKAKDLANECSQNCTP